jgi:PAS domain S-box-containing protein
MTYFDGLGGLVEHAGVAVVTTDEHGLITGLNRAAEALYGLTRHDALGEEAEALLTPAHLAIEHRRLTHVAMRERRVITLNTEQRTRAGTLFSVYLALSPIVNEFGAVVGAGRFVADISRLLSAHKAAQHERDMLDALLDTTADPILMLDCDGRPVIANQAFETAFRLPRFKLLGRDLETLLTMVRARRDLPIALASLLASFANSTANPQSSGGEIEVSIPERRAFLWHTSPVYAHNGTLIGRMFAFRDVTSEREVDRMKTDFVALVSHELRTPLQSIKGFADLVLEGDAGSMSDEVREYVHIIRQNTERLTGLISDILDLTQHEARKLELNWGRHKVRDLVEAAIAPLRARITLRAQSIQVYIPDYMPDMRADRERFCQILGRLVENACKFTGDGGKIRIRVSILGDEDTLPPGAISNVRLPALLVSVHDTGIGIPYEEQAQVFTPFYRATPAAEKQIQGTGLGLALTKALVELHGGRIWFNSEEGRGTSFYFTLPHDGFNE